MWPGPFHEGELSIQERLGERRQAVKNGEAISDAIIIGALPFIARQPLGIVGTVDQHGDVWASTIVGQPGWMHAPDGSAVLLDLTRTRKEGHEPMWASLAADPRVGMLIIEMETRRRIRINGTWAWLDQDHARVDVVESYPNCPKYIQKRVVHFHKDRLNLSVAAARTGDTFTAEQLDMMRRADTFFVASSHPTGQIDASHRGGMPGFVEVLDERTLRIPDCAGNSMYNTLGNRVVNPSAGLLFADFQSNRQLQLIGRAVILFDPPEDEPTSGGTNRHWLFHVKQWIETDLPGALSWELLEYSPYNPQ